MGAPATQIEPDPVISDQPWKHWVILTGAGVSAESGLKTFRDANGLWENVPVDEVCTAEAWQRNPGKVLAFYNDRRQQILAAEPNAAHRAMVELEEHFEVTVITQNIDNLHERAGSTRVVHLHGEICMARSTGDDSIHPIQGSRLDLGDCCPAGYQLRPHVVFFGEPVPMMPRAIEIVRNADRLLIVGTSLTVFPAASLIHHVPTGTPMVWIDPAKVAVPPALNIVHIRENATAGMKIFMQSHLDT